MKSKLPGIVTHLSSAVLAAGLMLGAGYLHAQSLSITGVISQTVGTESHIPAGGSANNTTPWAVGTVGVFEINGGDYYMQVNATSPTGGMDPAKDSLMVVRTVNSQGLTDNGTLSVYGRPDPLTNTEWSLNLNFSFFSDSALTTAAIINNMMLTSLDIDYDQRYFVSNSTFDSSQTYSTVMDGPSAITTPGTVPSGYTGFTAAGDSTFNNPTHAVSSIGNGSSFDVQIAHVNVALFMFEFRNPSSIITIPEPTSAVLIFGSVSLFGLIRRRTRG